MIKKSLDTVYGLDETPILRNELHLLDQSPPDDFVVFLELQRKRLPVEHLVLEVLLNEGFTQITVGYDAELHLVKLGELLT